MVGVCVDIAASLIDVAKSALLTHATAIARGWQLHSPLFILGVCLAGLCLKSPKSALAPKAMVDLSEIVTLLKAMRPTSAHARSSHTRLCSLEQQAKAVTSGKQPALARTIEHGSLGNSANDEAFRPHQGCVLEDVTTDRHIAQSFDTQNNGTSHDTFTLNQHNSSMQQGIQFADAGDSGMLAGQAQMPGAPVEPSSSTAAFTASLNGTTAANGAFALGYNPTYADLPIFDAPTYTGDYDFGMNGATISDMDLSWLDDFLKAGVGFEEAGPGLAYSLGLNMDIDPSAVTAMRAYQ